MRWKVHLCRKCEPVDWASCCEACTHPTQFRWFNVDNFPSWNSASERRIRCETLPYAPIAYSQTDILARFDDLRQYAKVRAHEREFLLPLRAPFAKMTLIMH